MNTAMLVAAGQLQLLHKITLTSALLLCKCRAAQKRHCCISKTCSIADCGVTQFRKLPFSSLGKGLGLVHDGAAQVTLEGLHELVVQVGQLLLEQLPHHGRQLALQLLLLGLPHACLKIASLLLIACTQAHVRQGRCDLFQGHAKTSAAWTASRPAQGTEPAAGSLQSRSCQAHAVEM